MSPAVLLATGILATVRFAADLPAWTAELILLPFLGWVGIVIVKHGNDLKERPTREEITHKERAAADEHRRLSDGMEENARIVTDNVARIEALTQRMDAHRRELDEISAAARRAGERAADAVTDAADKATVAMLELSGRLVEQYHRLEDRVNEIDKFVSRRKGNR